MHCLEMWNQALSWPSRDVYMIREKCERVESGIRDNAGFSSNHTDTRSSVNSHNIFYLQWEETPSPSESRCGGLATLGVSRQLSPGFEGGNVAITGFSLQFTLASRRGAGSLRFRYFRRMNLIFGELPAGLVRGLIFFALYLF